MGVGRGLQKRRGRFPRGAEGGGGGLRAWRFGAGERVVVPWWSGGGREPPSRERTSGERCDGVPCPPVVCCGGACWGGGVRFSVRSFRFGLVTRTASLSGAGAYGAAAGVDGDRKYAYAAVWGPS